MDVEDKFVSGAPSGQNVVDLFKTEWSSKMPVDCGFYSEPGHADLFNDPRVRWAVSELGPLNGMNIVELGPLEGAHSYMMEQLGADSVTAIESNTRAFLKCLCVKELFNLKRVKFLLGDFFPYLESSAQIDLIFASGVLYHMIEPVKLLELLCSKSNNIFIWSHYYDAKIIETRADHDLFAPCDAINRSAVRGSKRLYPEAALSWSGFSGGAHSYSVWLERDSLISFFTERGFNVRVNFDQIDHPNGPAIALCASK